MTIDTEKVFDLVQLLSLIPASEKLSFRTDFINWIKTWIKKLGVFCTKQSEEQNRNKALQAHYPGQQHNYEKVLKRDFMELCNYEIVVYNIKDFDLSLLKTSINCSYFSCFIFFLFLNSWQIIFCLVFKHVILYVTCDTWSTDMKF